METAGTGSRETGMCINKVVKSVGVMTCLFGREDADRVSVLFDGDSHLGEDGLSLQSNHFRPFQLILPRLIQFCKRGRKKKERKE